MVQKQQAQKNPNPPRRLSLPEKRKAFIGKLTVEKNNYFVYIKRLREAIAYRGAVSGEEWKTDANLSEDAEICYKECVADLMECRKRMEHFKTRLMDISTKLKGKEK